MGAHFARDGFAVLAHPKALVRTQLRLCSRGMQDRLTVAVNVESWHQAALIVTGWHAGRVRRPRPLNRLGVQPMADPRASVVHPACVSGDVVLTWKGLV